MNPADSARNILAEEPLLVVDGEDAFRMRLVRALEDRGFVAWGAADGNQARAIAGGGKPRSVPSSISHAEIVGELAIVRQLHALDATTRIVVLTGYGSIATALDAMRSGATHYLDQAG